MSAFRTDYFPPSNRRRCVKGRSSYTESSDLCVSADVNQDQNSNGFSHSEDSYIDSVHPEDGEEEDITIDLSAFLNDNPLLAQAAFETSSENNVASTESSSQFRVTDCKVDPSEIPKVPVTDSSFSVDVNGHTSVDSNVTNENTVPHTVDSHTFLHNNAKESCTSPEKILTNVTNSEPVQSIALNGKKTVISPTKKLSKALGLSNPLKKYKNFMKSKDLNKVNEKVFGKYPIVRCEKLDIENFVKNNKIKVRNWPLLHTENQKNNSNNKGANKKKISLNKSNLKPKFMKKPITFNKYLITTNKNVVNQNINSFLIDQADASKPIIIKTDSWKPGVTNVSSCVPSFFRPLTKTSLSTSKNVVCDILKLNDKTVSLNVISSPEKKCDIRTNAIAANISKLFNIPKSYPLIAPKPCAPPVNKPTPTTTKPVIETLTVPVADNFTVIEPYVDDPTSPQKPKPILTVPVEMVSSPEKQSPVINSNIITSIETTNTNNLEKLLKSEKSVFLNGAVKKIIIPTQNKADTFAVKKDVVQSKSSEENLLNKCQVQSKNSEENLLNKCQVQTKNSEENLLNKCHEMPSSKMVPKAPVVLKVKDVSSEENSSVLKAKNIVVDAMQSAFSSTQNKKNLKARPLRKPSLDSSSGNSILGSSAYSSILNDNILNGFSENDFEDVSLFEDDSFIDITHEISSSKESIPDNVNSITENSAVTPRSIKKARERKKYKRKKSSDDSPERNTVSVSECENKLNLEKDKRTVLSPENNAGNSKSSIVSKEFEKSLNIPVHPKVLNESFNKELETKHVGSSLLFPSFENSVSEFQSNINCNKFISPKVVEQTEIPLPSFNKNHIHNVNSPVKKCKESDNLMKQETSTRTLRDRKCSSPEVKNINSTKLNPHEKHSPEKIKIKDSINSKLKIQLKSPKYFSKVKLKKKSCKSEDIIQEVNTITGSHSNPKRGSPKSKKSYSEKDIKNNDYSDINIQNNSESNPSNVPLSKQLSPCSLSNRRKTLKVCIKRSKRKNTSHSKLSLNALTDVIDNANISNSVSESNLNLHSSFREAKDEKMGTLQKEDNSAVNSSSFPDCNMENSCEKLDQKEQIPLDAPGLMVNSSETHILEENNDVNSDINCTLSDNVLIVENENNVKELPNNFEPLSKDECSKKDFPSVDDIKNSENDSENFESLAKKNIPGTEMLPSLPVENSQNVTLSSEDDVTNNENDIVNCESLLLEQSNAIIERLSPLTIQNSKDEVFSSEDDTKNFENDSENSESLIKESNVAVIETLPALVVENSKDATFSEGDSVKCINSNFSNKNENDDDTLNENLHNICDFALNSVVNKDNENTFEKTENASSKITVENSEASTKDEHLKCDFVPEETAIEEIITTQIDDDTEYIADAPNIVINIDNEEEKSNPLFSVNSPKKSASSPSINNNNIKEEIIDNSDVPVNNLQVDENKNSLSSVDSPKESFSNLSVNDNIIEEEIIDNCDVPINDGQAVENKNSLSSIHSSKESASNFSMNDNIIEEEIIGNSDILSKDLHADENKVDAIDTCYQLTENLKTSILSPDNSRFVEKEISPIEESSNTSNDPSQNISKDTIHKFNENCEDFSENVKSPSLKCALEDKVLVSEEIPDLTDGVSNNLSVSNHNKIIDNSETDKANSSISSDITPEKEVIPLELSSAAENQQSNCQNNEISASSVSSGAFEDESSDIDTINCDETTKKVIPLELNSTAKNQQSSCQNNEINVSCASSETFEDESSDIDIINCDETTDTAFKEEILPNQEKILGKNDKSSTTAESKKCPKIKLFKRSDADSPDNLKNWFVSGSSETETKSPVCSEAKPNDIDIADSDKSHDLNVLPKLNSSSSVVNLDNKLIDKSNVNTIADTMDASDIALPEKTSSTFELNSSCEARMIGQISSEAQSVEKNSSSTSEEISVPNDKVLSENVNECASENLSAFGHKKSTKVSVSEKENFVHPVIIKEEPMDIEENTESADSCTSEQQSIKTESVPNKRKRGRPRKSIEYCNTSLDFEKVIPKKEVTTVPDIPVKLEEVTPKAEVKITPAARSSGQKRKSNSNAISTPSSGRRKNYDPELVCVPFSMGWMREHVIRATGKDNKQQSDIYYFSPEGTKLRSMPDIMTYLSKHPHIKLSAVNFTFAKELIYREPFEIERNAKTPFKKTCVSPTPKKSPKKPKAIISAADSTSSTESKKNVSLKRKRSSLNESDQPIEVTDTTLSSSGISKKSKQLPLTEFFSDNSKQTEDKPSRPSRKIVKKVPFDNSEETQPSKKSKLGTIVTRHSTGNLKINIKKGPTEIKKGPTERESLIVKIKSPSSNITKENELKNSESSKALSSEVKKNELTVTISSNSSSTPVSKVKKSKKEPCVNKPLNTSAKAITPEKTSSTSESMSAETLLSRTNIKSPLIQNRLKVKLGSKKSELAVLHKPCTKFCNFSYIRLPTVQCSVCLCLFHPECIPFKPTGLTKYACVPCVTTKLNSDNDLSEELNFPHDFDFGMLYPSILLQIVEDPVFNATYNKFYSPVDQSFAHTIGINEVRCQRPMQTYSMNNVTYLVDKNCLNPLRASTPRPNSNTWFSPRSFTVQNMRHSGPTPIPIQKSPNVNIQNIYPVNVRNLNNLQVRTTNPGSLPLLQNFSNAFFIQNQPFNNTSQSSSVTNQIPLQQSAALGTFTNPDNSKVHRTLFVRQMPNNQQISGLISTGNAQSVSDHTKNISVLQSMLQSRPDYANKQIKVIKFNDFSTLKISGNNIPSPLSLNVTSEINPSTSSAQISSITLSESSNNKRKSDHGGDKTTKLLKSNEPIGTKSSAQASSSPLKNNNASSFSEQLSACWNMNKFAQIYECLNFIFKFLNVSDLLRASLVCRSWNHLATQKLLWEHVSFSGIAIKDWVKCCKALQKHGTKCIDFRGLFDQDSDDDWKTFLENVNRLTDVEELIFEKVPPYVIKNIADSLPQLRKLICFCLTSIFTEPEIWSTPCEFELASLRCLGRLEALKISSLGGIHLTDNQLSLLPYLPNLTHLVLSGFKFNSCINLECLSQMQQLITLELGDCVDIEPQIYGLLSQLTNLENLCLQNGGDINDKKLSEALLKMNKLKTLELMNFQLSCHLADVLKKMDTLHHFSLWPDCRTKAKQVNFNSFKAATSCPNLKRLCWGILTDDETVPNTLEMKDSRQSQVKKMSFQELFQSLVKHNPGVKVELKCLPRSIWSEFCSTRNFI